ncbi:MAG: efflux RND transporter permease subunit [Myxococcota bacterium]|nr:efflux RND transporter permease subunit [Myxococcota bacterium]
MANLFFRNPRLSVLVAGLVLVAGFAAFQALPRQEDPSLSRRFATITTFYPGANALRVETLVTEKIEEELQELHEVVEIDSVSRTGVSLISVELADRFDESTVDEVWSKVRDRLDDAAALLPEGAGAPDFEDQTSKAVTLLVGLSWEGSGEAPLAVMSRLADELGSRLRNLPGTKEAERFGEAREEIRVSVDPLALAAVNLTAAQVSAAIARADAKLPAGQLRHRTNDLLLEVEGELTSVERVRDVPVQRDEAGRILRVGDIARVERAVREPAESVAILGGRRGVAVAATMEDRQRVDLWAESARDVVAAFTPEVPRGVRLEILFDQSVYTQERLTNLAGNLVLGMTIVLGVLFVMMGFRSALIVATALPLTVAAVLAELNFLGIPLHQMSITGLIIALGLLIDNAIVVVEEFSSRARKGEPAASAVAGTVRHLFVPLSASTLTTVLAFLPIALMPGGAGEFVGPISIGVCLAVISSFAISITLVVTLAGLTSGRVAPRPGEAPWWRAGISSPLLLRWYRASLRLVLERPLVGVAFSMLLPIVGFAVAGSLPSQFFPANDRNQFQIQVALASQASIAETLETVADARRIVHAREEVVASHWFAGESSPRVFYNMMGADEGISSIASAFVTTKSATATESLLPDLQRELMERFPKARVIALPFEQGPPFEAPIEVRIVGPDADVLRGLGEEVRGLLAATRSVTYTTAKLSGGEPKLVIAADEDEARLSGLGLADIADQLNARLEGSLGGTLLEGTEEVPVRVRVESGARDTLSAIAAGRVLPPERSPIGDSGRVAGVPLGAVAELQLVPELGGITRRNGERSNTVQAYLEPYALISESLADFERRRAEAGIELPAGYRIEFGGEDEQRSQAVSNLMAFALPLFVVMVGAIVLSFNSFRLAGVIFAVAVLGVGLALFGVWLFGHPLGFIAIVGTMGLVGLAINDAIVVLAALRESPEAARADVDGTIDVVCGATRHILATTFTTMGGFFPLIAFGGRFWPPMATAIAGGVAGASILALYFVPSVYIAIRRRDLRAKRRQEVSAPPAEAVAAAAAAAMVTEQR